MAHMESEAPPTLGEQFRMKQGLEIHRKARILFPNGVEPGGKGISDQAEQTAQLMTTPEVTTIFEATFIDGIYATKADVIQRTDDGWHLYEIKSSVNDKPEHIDDMAYTSFVMERAASKPVNVSLILVSRDYRLGQPDTELFRIIEMGDKVLEQATAFAELADGIAKSVLSEDQPSASLIRECRDCPYFQSDCLGANVEFPVFDIPRLTGQRFQGLADAGIVSVTDIPDDYALTARQAATRDLIRSGEPILRDGLKAFIEDIEWPARYLDFETVMTAIPLYPDIPPYTQIPTQYSVHVCESPGEIVDHHEFFASPGVDPRQALVIQLLDNLGDSGSIVVYFSSFERTRLKALAERFPELADRLTACIDRLFDLEVAFKKHYQHPMFHGKSSIKVTLPVLVPELSYNDLEIGDGGAAMAAFAFIEWGEYTPEEIDRIRRLLLEYCKQDTEAMVRLHQHLVQLVSKQ